MAGKRVRCPKCRQIFLVEVDEEDEAPAPKKGGRAAPAVRKAPAKRRPRGDDDEDDERPAKKKSRRREEAEDDDEDSGPALTPEARRKLRQKDKKIRLKRVFMGLTIAMFKLWSLIVLMLILLVRVNIQSAVDVNEVIPNADKEFAPDSVKMFKDAVTFCQYLLTGMVMITPSIGIASCAYCLLTPKKSEAGGSVMTSLVFDVVPLVASFLIPIAAFNVFGLSVDQQDRFISLLITGCTVFSIMALFMFIIYLRITSIYLLEVKAAADALNMLAWLMLMTASGGLFMALHVYIAAFFAGLGGQLMSLGVGFLFSIIWFGVLYYILFNGTMAIIKGLRTNVGLSTGLISEEDEEEEDEEEDEDEEDDD